MSDVTQILLQIEAGDLRGSEQLLPLVYDELRKLAAVRIAQEKPGQTLQATALVHEAYLRLVKESKSPAWNSQGHFFGAAAEAMRRILVENARRKARLKHGGGREHEELDSSKLVAREDSGDILELDAALNRLAQIDPRSAQLVKLRYFAGLTNVQAANMLGISPRTADSWWAFARAWLRREMAEGGDSRHG